MSALLNCVVFLPAAGAVLILVLSRQRPQRIREAALAVSLITFVLSLPLAFAYDYSDSARTMQFGTDVVWMESPAIRYHVAVDGISLFLVLLTTFLTVLSVLISWRSVTKHVKEFFFFLLLLETGTVGVFAAVDLFLFYVFWEVTLVPMYFLIGIWGHERRVYAALKFFLFTVIGSLLMLVGIIWLYTVFGTFDSQQILAMLATGARELTFLDQFWLFLAFFAAFAIKAPLFPFHTWLPDVHVEAPTAGSVMLAGVLLKMGAYGLLRFCLPMFPEAAHAMATPIMVLALIGIIYGSLVAMVQPDLKKLIAYSSVAHLGFVVLGIFSFHELAVEGAVYQMLNHGVSTGALFLLSGMIYERLHTRQISEMGGLATPAPVLATLFLITTLSSIGLPLLNNFVGEFLILLGVLQDRVLYAALAATGVVFSAAYMLWMYQRVFLGKVSARNESFPDLNRREQSILLAAVALMIVMGVRSPFFLRQMDTSTDELLGRAGLREMRVERVIPNDSIAKEEREIVGGEQQVKARVPLRPGMIQMTNTQGDAD